MKMKMKTRLNMIWMVLAWGLLLVGSAQAADYAVVVNTANSYSGNPETVKQVVKQLYLKDRSEHNHGLIFTAHEEIAEVLSVINLLILAPPVLGVTY